MKMALLIACAAVSLSGCATVLTPARCASIDTAAATVEEIAAVLIGAGIEPARAAKLAEAVKVGQMALAVACAQSNPPPVAAP